MRSGHRDRLYAQYISTIQTEMFSKYGITTNREIWRCDVSLWLNRDPRSLSELRPLCSNFQTIRTTARIA